MGRCTGRRDMTEILLKTALNSIQSINQLSSANYFSLEESKICHLGKVNLHRQKVQRLNHCERHSKSNQGVKVPIAANLKEFVYKMKVNPIHTIIKYGDYHDFMDR